MPRGQCVQFDKCNSSLLEDFSCENDNSSYTEDNINVFESNNVTLRRGLVDGNNSPSGDGIMYECGNRAHAYMSCGLVEDVDAVHQGNGCFGGWGVSNLIFRNVRASATHCTGWAGRGKPSSGALVFAGGTEGGAAGQPSSGLMIENATYQALCKQNLVWPASAFATRELAAGVFTPRAPLRLEFCFSSGTISPTLVSVGALKTDDAGARRPAKMSMFTVNLENTVPIVSNSVAKIVQ